MSSWTITEVPADPSHAAQIAAMVDVRTAVTLDTWGTLDLADPVAVDLAALVDQSFTRHGFLAAVDDGGRTLGAVFLDLPQQDNQTTAWLNLLVAPGERGRGIGTALHDAAIDWLRAHGRSVAQASTDQRAEPPAGPGTLAPPTGAGLVAADDRDVRFMRSRGWVLEQVSRRSVLVLPLPDGALRRFQEESAAAAGPDYRLVAWGGRTPDEWLDQYSYVLSRMSTDAPVAGLEWGQQAWNGTRVRALEDRAREGGYRLLVLAAEHVPTHTLAAFTNVWAPPHTGEVAHQGDTLVVPEHRGRRLGMLVKAANLRRLSDELPAVRRVDTWNAEENRWMLAINVALGFRPSGGAGEWQRVLA
ncbi:MAG TPA: GNAT family N-acetyltransferase [Cellulomonas sp.]